MRMRVLSFFAIFVLFTLVMLSPGVAQMTMRGDVTEDGIVDGRDALKIMLVLEELMQAPDPGDIFWFLADVYPSPGTGDRDIGDGQVTREDVQRILRAAVGLISISELSMPPYLLGDPDSLARDAIPPQPIPQGDPADISPLSDSSGALISRTRIMLYVEENATLGEVNAAIQAVDGAIIGAIPAMDMLLIRVPDTPDTSVVENAVVTLGDLPGIDSADLDFALEIVDPIEAEPEERATRSMLAPPASSLRDLDGNPAWIWNSPAGPGGFPYAAHPDKPPWRNGNWGLEAIRMPQAWNLMDYISRQRHPLVKVTVMDTGFQSASNPHPDLRSLQVINGSVFSQTPDEHGQHVAGIIGANSALASRDWVDNGDNRDPATGLGIGVDGINPFAQVTGVPDLPSLSSVWLDHLERSLNENPRVVNMSLGFDNLFPFLDPWTAWRPGTLCQELILKKQASHGEVLFCASAGNDSNHDPALGPIAIVNSEYNSPLNWAAHNGSSNILVVESVDSTGFLSYFSNTNGTVSAPGSDILSTVLTTDPPPALPGGYNFFSGTSMASPHVAGLASYLLAVDPSLMNHELRQLLTLRNPHQPNNVPNRTDNAKNMIDAWQAVMNIDVTRGNRDVQRGLCNVDDGTPHGNDPRVGHELGSDDLIDMADFRRFRDAILEANGQYPNDQIENLNPDEPGESKQMLREFIRLKTRDINRNGFLAGAVVPGGAEVENVYPRFDFNGDGRVNRAGRSRHINRPLLDRVGNPAGATDLDVLADLWPANGDEGWEAQHLPQLLDSGDLEIDVSAMFATGEGDVALSFKRADGVDMAPRAPVRHVSPKGDKKAIVTLPLEGQAPADRKVTATRSITGVGEAKAELVVTLERGRLEPVKIAPGVFGIEPAFEKDEPLFAFAAAGLSTPDHFRNFAGTLIRITGNDFGPVAEHRILFPNAAILVPPLEAAAGLTSDASKLLVRVPVNVTTGQLEVDWSKDGRTVTSTTPMALRVLGKPTITEMRPDTSIAGETMVITGANFGRPNSWDGVGLVRRSTVIVRFTTDYGTTDVTPYSIENNMLKLIIPNNAITGEVTVLTPAGVESAGVFTRLPGLPGGAVMHVSSAIDDLDTNSTPKHLTLREAMLLAKGRLDRALVNDGDRPRDYGPGGVDEYGVPETLEEGDYVYGTPGDDVSDTIYFVKPETFGYDPGIETIKLVGPLPIMDTGADDISADRGDPTNPGKIHRTDPSEVMIDASALPASINGVPTAALHVASDGNGVRIGVEKFPGFGILVEGKDNEIVGCHVRNGTTSDTGIAAIRISGGGRNRVDTCYIHDNGGDGIEITGGSIDNNIRANLISGNFYGIKIHGPGTDANVTEGNFIGVETVMAGGEEHAIFPGNRAGGMVIEAGSGNNEITHDRIGGNSGIGLRIHGAGTDGNTIRGDLLPDSQTKITIGGQGKITVDEKGKLVKNGGQGNTTDYSRGNAGHGILVSGGAKNTHILNASILGNTGDGIRIIDVGTDDTIIESCKIGQISGDLAGIEIEPNDGSGIVIEGDEFAGGPAGTQILPQTIITSNGEYGIHIARIRNQNKPTILKSPLNIGFKPGQLGNDAGPIAPPHGKAGMRIEDSEYIIMEGGLVSWATDNIMAGEKFGVQIIRSNHLTFGYYFFGRSAKTGILLLDSNHNTFIGTRAVYGQANGWILINSSNNIWDSLPGLYEEVYGAAAHNRNDGQGMIIGKGCRDNLVEGLSVHDNGSNGIVIDAEYVPAQEALPENYVLNIPDPTTSGNTISNCDIGLEVDSSPLGNKGHGLVVKGGAKDTRIEYNIISANGAGEDNVGDGIHISGSDTKGITIQGNLVGTNGDGTDIEFFDGTSFGNDGDGLDILDAEDIQIGGLGDGNRNLFSGNWDSGIYLYRTKRVVIENNYFGLNADGTAPLGNNDHGVYLRNVEDVTVGSLNDDLRNVVSGNGAVSGDGNGIHLEGNQLARVHIYGNFIGTDAAGSVQMPNKSSGIRINGAGQPGKLVMDDTNRSIIGPLNVISGNDAYGILVDAVTGLVIHHNIIGADAEHGLPGNGIDGIHLRANVIGTRVENNKISDNKSNGIAVDVSTSSQNTLRTNYIGGNSSKGIDLFAGEDPVPPPVFASTVSGYITGTVAPTVPDGSMVELFGTTTAQGEVPLGVAFVSAGQFFSPVFVPGNLLITATVTVPDGTTSEFSEPAVVIRPKS